MLHTENKNALSIVNMINEFSMNFYISLTENDHSFNGTYIQTNASQSSPSIAIQTNGASINPGLKLALEKSLNKVLFGHKIKHIEQKLSNTTNEDQLIPSSNIEKDSKIQVSLNLESRKPLPHSKYQKLSTTELHPSVTNELNPSWEPLKKSSERKPFLSVGQDFNHCPEIRESRDKLDKYCYVFIIAFKIEVRLKIPQGILCLYSCGRKLCTC